MAQFAPETNLVLHLKVHGHKHTNKMSGDFQSGVLESGIYIKDLFSNHATVSIQNTFLITFKNK